ncbi:MAG: ATP-binding protein [Peptococcaceae bacterium]|nr:ATP-binding protein [Peptococcaceae bacterium]
MIPRDTYLRFLLHSKDKQIIKVISGVRRCGKSTLLEIYREHLLAKGVEPRQIIFINFEDISYENLQHYRSLYDYITTKLLPEKMNYIFLDEIQHVADFEKAVDSLFIKKNTDIYITGSNAYFMSGELATLLSGRYIELKMLPLSFREYCLGTDQAIPIPRKYVQYTEHGSFPYTLQYNGKTQAIRDYLDSLYNTVLIKDIVSRYRISDVMMLQSVTKFVFDSIGSQLSVSRIANTMTSAGRKIDSKTVEKYIRALTGSMMIYQANRYNIKGKQHLKTLEKYFVVDIGLRYMLLGKRHTDIGHILENVVYLELLRRGYSVYVGQIGDAEVDFVAMNGDGTTYLQVAASVRDNTTLRRELSSLQKISDHYPKLLLTLDDDPTADYDGIRRINGLDWLLGETK